MVKEAQRVRCIHIVVDSHRCFLGRYHISTAFLGQEVITHLGIGVKNACEMRHSTVVADGITNRAISIETNLVVLTQNGNSFQIIGCRSIEHLGDFITTRAIHLYLRRVRKAHTLQLIIGNLIHTTLRDGDFNPLACSKLRCSRIDRSVERAGIASTENG